MPSSVSSDRRSSFYQASTSIIQKFGGTSIGKFPLNIVQNVIRPYVRDHRVIVVCSARSVNTKGDGNIQSICTENIEACQAYIKSPIIVRHLITDILNDLVATLDILERVHTAGKVTSETLDTVISMGKKLACLFLSGLLQDQSIASKVIDLSQSLKVLPGQAINQELYDKISESIVTTVKQSDIGVRVKTGCFGGLPGGLLASVGRGYTDLCASFLASGVQASELLIWKEVEGFYTADPRRVASARLTSSLTLYEALELSLNGSEIIHSEAMNPARHSKIPIRVKDVMNPSGAGTIIRPEYLCENPQTTVSQKIPYL